MHQTNVRLVKSRIIIIDEENPLTEKRIIWRQRLRQYRIADLLFDALSNAFTNGAVLLLVLGVLRLLPSGQKPSSSRFMSHWPLLGVVRMGCERQALLRQVDIALRKTKAQCRRHAPHFLFRFASCTYGGGPVLMPPSRKVIILLDVLLLPVSTIK